MNRVDTKIDNKNNFADYSNIISNSSDRVGEAF